jgi:hypothetical protein
MASRFLENCAPTPDLYYILSASLPADPGSRTAFAKALNTRQFFVVPQTITFSALAYLAKVTSALLHVTKVVDW